jgi:hypothetical protein
MWRENGPASSSSLIRRPAGTLSSRSARARQNRITQEENHESQSTTIQLHWAHRRARTVIPHGPARSGSLAELFLCTDRFGRGDGMIYAQGDTMSEITSQAAIGWNLKKC